MSSGTNTDEDDFKISNANITSRIAQTETIEFYKPPLESSYDLQSCPLTTDQIVNGIAHTIAHWKVLAFGQILSLAQSGVGASASTLAKECALSSPTFQFGLLYFCLFFNFLWMAAKHYYFRWTAFGKKKNDIQSTTLTLREDAARASHTIPLTSILIRGPWWFYFATAVLDIESSFFYILSFRYTTITSVALFYSLTIPAAMITSRWVLGSRYNRSHYFGALICLVGVAINVAIDIQEEEDAAYPHKMLGDGLAIVAGLLRGAVDVLQELLIKKFSKKEFLAMTGLYGTMISCIQVYILEVPEVIRFFDGSSVCGKSEGLGILLGFIISNYVCYVGSAHFLLISEAALFNLSLLTSDLYSVLFSIFEQHIIPKPLFFLALTVIVSGVVVYEIGPSPKVEIKDDQRSDLPLSDTALGINIELSENKK